MRSLILLLSACLLGFVALAEAFAYTILGHDGTITCTLWYGAPLVVALACLALSQRGYRTQAGVR